MNARRYKTRVGLDGSVALPEVGLAPGTEVEVILFESAELHSEADFNLASLTALLAEPALASYWDSPEEDEAWRDI